jgi:hypothetical protein
MITPVLLTGLMPRSRDEFGIRPYATLGAMPEPASHGNGVASRLLARAIRYGPLLVCRASGETLYRYAA